MATRGYSRIERSFWYDFVHYGGGIGFLVLDDPIPAGFTVLNANVHTILAITGAAVNIYVAGSVDGRFTDALTPATLVIGTSIPFPMLNDRPFSSAAQNLGMEISGGAITAGRIVIVLEGVIITET